MSPAWPRRPRLVAGNWKMNKTAPEGAALARELVTLLAGGRPCEIAVFPTFTSLDAVNAVSMRLRWSVSSPRAIAMRPSTRNTKQVRFRHALIAGCS